jgi:aromatic-L-amino-acid/L-tryptophan decarboxylase
VVAARSRYQREHSDAKAEELVIYTTTQTHSLGTKAGLVLGLQVCTLEVRPEDNYALRGDTLRSALEEDEKLGRKPFILSELQYMPFKYGLNYLHSCHRWHHIFRCN